LLLIVLPLIILIASIANTQRFKGIKVEKNIQDNNKFIEDLNIFVTNPTGLSKYVMPPQKVNNSIYLKYKHLIFREFAITLTRILLLEKKVIFVGPTFIIDKLIAHFNSKDYILNINE